MKHELKNCENTIHRSIRFLKGVFNYAQEQGHIENNPIAGYKTKHILGKRDFLNKEELLLIHEVVLQLKNRRLQQVGLAFLFACYTGLRFSDIKQLKPQQISDNLIRITMQKTNREVTIPVNQRAAAILKMVQTPLSVYVFKTISNQKTNNYLKEIAEIAGIHKNLTFHVARHTFATVSIELGIPIEVVSKLLGHQDIKTTMLYARILDTVKIQQMQKWNF